MSKASMTRAAGVAEQLDAPKTDAAWWAEFHARLQSDLLAIGFGKKIEAKPAVASVDGVDCDLRASVSIDRVMMQVKLPKALGGSMANAVTVRATFKVGLQCAGVVVGKSEISKPEAADVAIKSEEGFKEALAKAAEIMRAAPEFEAMAQAHALRMAIGSAGLATEKGSAPRL